MKLLQTKPFGEAEETRVSAGSRTRPVVVGARRVKSKNRLRLCSTWRRWRLYFMLSVFGGDSDQKKPKPLHSSVAQDPSSHIRNVSVWLEMTD